MIDLAAIRARHEQEAAYRQVCPCSLCVKHEDRGALLAMVDELRRQLDAYVASDNRVLDKMATWPEAFAHYDPSVDVKLMPGAPVAPPIVFNFKSGKETK